MYDSLYNDKTTDYYSHARPELLEFVPQGIKTVLDIGCGRGEFGQLLKDRLSVNVWGIEPDKPSADIAKTRLDVVINGYFTESSARELNQQFDAIFFNDVLEHLIEPEQVLNLCRNLLTPNGVIIASIPNIRHYTVLNELIFDQDFRYKESGPLDKTHLRFFTKKSIVRLFADCNLTLDILKGINIEKPQGRKIKLLKMFLPSYLADIDVLQYAVVARFQENG